MTIHGEGAGLPAITFGRHYEITERRILGKAPGDYHPYLRDLLSCPLWGRRLAPFLWQG